MRRLITVIGLLLFAGSVLAQPLLVLKSPTCGCCEGWMEHLDAEGFTTRHEHPENLSQRKADLAIAPRYQSCHTGISEQGFVFEGHVPAKFIRNFIANPPANAIGLSVPGMPIGTPGMERGERFTPYTIWALYRDGSSTAYAVINSPEQQF